MNNIVLVLMLLLLGSGVVFLLDIFIFAPKRKKLGQEPSHIIESIKSIFPVLLIVLLIRSFLVQPYRVPTGSLEPTIMPGDFILVNQFSYGLRLPLLNKKIVDIGEPKRGDITLFQFPKNRAVVYVKRIIGLPGDYIEYSNKELYVNGEHASQKIIQQDLAKDDNCNAEFNTTSGEDEQKSKVLRKVENFLGVSHDILVSPSKNHGQDYYLIVPEGQYFVMGDNRDSSYDSRYWGFVPEENLIGKAMCIWFSWDKSQYKVCWHRIGKTVH